MTKKKKEPISNKQKIIGLIIVLALGIFGISAPKELYQYFGLDQKDVNVSQKANPKDQPTATQSGIEDLGKANFSKSQLTNQSKGYIVYEEKDNLGRPQGAYGLFKKAMINTGTSANPNVRPPGFISGKSPYLHSRGHLIGRQMGGSGDDPRNLVTLYQQPVNTPYMTKYENEIRAALDAKEEDQLEEEKNKLSNYQKIVDVLSGTYQILSGEEKQFFIK